MLIKRFTSADVSASEITDEAVYMDRRRFIATAGTVGAAAMVAAVALRGGKPSGAGRVVGAAAGAVEDDKPNSYEDITSYNNYYEFGTDKGDPKDNSGGFHPQPWSVKVEGLCRKPGDYHLDDLLRGIAVEDRTYRLRCVEAWSMVIPWQGVPLSAVLAKLAPQPVAKFVELTTVYRPSEMPGQRRPILDWPYLEGLRLDEAMHPLTILATGLYGKPLPNQDGAPLRLVVPWKYGFKSVKAIAKIAFTDRQPDTAWMRAAPDEYGFYANVNPTVDHPRWTQARERRIGEFRRRETLMFNGYGDQVAHLYAGMDLRRNF